MHALKLTQIGNSVGVILPKEVLARLKLARGDTVYVTETPDGFALTPLDPGFEQQLEVAASSCATTAIPSGRWPNELALD